MESSAQLPLFAFMLLLIGLTLIWHSWRSRRVLERWAERNGYRIIDADYRNFFRGPYFWTTAKGQTVYRVNVEVKGGVRRGWVRCGSWGLGLFSDRTEVRWDETPAVADRWGEAPTQTANPMHDRWLDG